MTRPRAEAPASHPALPTSVEECPPLDPRFGAALDSGLAELGLRGGPADRSAARRTYTDHARLLAAWGSAINLTAIRDPAEVALRHVCDSLSAVPHLASRLGAGTTLLDLGSGAGYPGLPLAAALPFARVLLLDSVAKKARFLEVAGGAVAAALGRAGEAGPAIEVLAERSEDLAEEPDQRAAWDVVTARAVGSLGEIVELALPLLREGGWLVAWKREVEGSGLADELRAAGDIIRRVGGGRPLVRPVPGSSLASHRLVLLRKERPTPAGYPRPPALRRGARRGSGRC